MSSPVASRIRVVTLAACARHSSGDIQTVP